MAGGTRRGCCSNGSGRKSSVTWKAGAGWPWKQALSGWNSPVGRLTLKGVWIGVDSHESRGLMIWDYKTGVLPGKNNVTEERHGFQLAGYLLAVQQGLSPCRRTRRPGPALSA